MGSDKLPTSTGDRRISSINSIKGSQLHKVEIKRFLLVIFQVEACHATSCESYQRNKLLSLGPTKTIQKPLLHSGVPEGS